MRRHPCVSAVMVLPLAVLLGASGPAQSNRPPADDLVSAVRKGDITKAKRILAKRSDGINGDITWKITSPRTHNSLVVSTCLLVIAVSRGDKSMVDLLLDAGANADGTSASTATPLFAATFESGMLTIDKRSGKITSFNEEIIDSLLNHGADVNRGINGMTTTLLTEGEGINHWFFGVNRQQGLYVDVDGYFLKDSRPIHMAAAQQLPRLVVLFLGRGATVDAKNGFGLTPLHVAVRVKGLKTATLLLERGADVDAQDSGGQTPLMMAAAGGALDLVKLLLGKGAHVSAKDTKGRTALDHAEEGGHKEIADLLRSRR